MIAPTIGIDLDGVLLDTHKAWRDYMDEHRDAHGHAEACVSPYPTWNYPKDLCAKCFNKCLSSKLLPKTNFVDGAVQGIRALFDMGCTLHLISGRREQHTPLIAERLYDAAILRCFYTVNLGHPDKVALCDSLDVDIMLDDAPHVLESLRQSLITLPVAFAYPYNKDFHPRVKNWPEFVTLVKELEVVA